MCGWYSIINIWNVINGRSEGTCTPSYIIQYCIKQSIWEIFNSFEMHMDYLQNKWIWNLSDHWCLFWSSLLYEFHIGPVSTYVGYDEKVHILCPPPRKTTNKWILSFHKDLNNPQYDLSHYQCFVCHHLTSNCTFSLFSCGLAWAPWGSSFLTLLSAGSGKLQTRAKLWGDTDSHYFFQS